MFDSLSLVSYFFYKNLLTDTDIFQFSSIIQDLLAYAFIYLKKSAQTMYHRHKQIRLLLLNIIFINSVLYCNKAIPIWCPMLPYYY